MNRAPGARAFLPASGIRGGRRLVLLVVAAALLLVPLTGSRFAATTLTEMLVFAIFAMSLDLLVGYTGLVSLGHAAPFGVAAYTVALLSTHGTAALAATLPAALVAGTAAAALIGVFALRAAGVYFLMLTLAFAQMAFAVAHEWAGVTGGTNGLSGIPRPALPAADLGGAVPFYYLVLLLAGLAAVVLARITRSPFGAALAGVRENEARMRAMGYDTFRLKMAAFVIAGAAAALSGALYAYYNGFVSPDVLYWTTSGQVLVMVLLGGAGTLAGPAAGAAAVLLLQNLASSYTERWTLILGAAFILVVLAAPSGLAGVAARLGGPLRRLRAANPGAGPLPPAPSEGAAR
ncbi:MAG TPA: branched-chain amino acid ABC transporter permease [bacterium]|nr:branched-chain amino acid ABC transporter permease [bacterium]